jgi:hypothetical protein
MVFLFSVTRLRSPLPSLASLDVLQSHQPSVSVHEHSDRIETHALRRGTLVRVKPRAARLPYPEPDGDQPAYKPHYPDKCNTRLTSVTT